MRAHCLLDYLQPSEIAPMRTLNERRRSIRWSSLLKLAALVRAALLLYGEWQDANFAFKYTDIDYVVFTDAAGFMHAGESPFNRATYRYTPVLAWMLQPNIWLHRAFGKVLFVLGDLVVGCIIYAAGRERGLQEGEAVAYAAAWLLNPISINVSTRGNAEAILSALIVGWLYLLLQRRTVAAAVLYGFSVHFKLYPIIYAPALALFINYRYTGSPCRPWWHLAELFNRQRILFATVSAAAFILPTGLYYAHYGWEFIWEAYLYHFARTFSSPVVVFETLLVRLISTYESGCVQHIACPRLPAMKVIYWHRYGPSAQLLPLLLSTVSTAGS